MHGGGEITAVVVLCLALAVGAAARVLSQRTRFPYTVAMLLAGLSVGLFVPRVVPNNELLATIVRGEGISPNLLLFVFLPALVFESAFALDAHAFVKHAGFVLLLAAPALVVTGGLTAAWMVGLTSASWQWSWPAALLFGALISATDPIAVVAILRDVGAPKRLGLWIEGESLLNDGTAIVVFGIVLSFVTGSAVEVSVLSIVTELGRVAGGGVLVGVLAGLATAAWIGRSFEDSMVEVTLTLVVGFTAMVVAEHFLHVSGVLAVVSAGLFLAGPGRTRISPAVQPVLHVFWELLAYIANTVIFFLVGLVIAANLDHASLNLLWIISAGFVGVVVVRFVVTFAFRALGNRWVRPPIEAREATVMAWGGLRGAVSLALALMVAQRTDVDAMLRHQVLQVTAGIVLLTILVNGATTRGLLSKLGFMQPSPAEQLTDARVRTLVLDSVLGQLDEAAESPALRALPWSDVHRQLEERRASAQQALGEARSRYEEAGFEARFASAWRHAIAVERRFYVEAFKEGTLGARALEVLEHDVALHLDRLDAGEHTPPERRAEGVTVDEWLAPLARRLGLGPGRFAFARWALRYDLARAQTAAAQHVRDSVDPAVWEDEHIAEEIGQTYAHYQREARARLEDLRTHLPEVATAIEQRLAIRLVLNFERAAYERLARRGELQRGGLERALSDVRARMKRLHFERRRAQLRDLVSLVRDSPLFRRLDEDTIQQVGQLMRELTLHPGEWLFHEGEVGDALYLVARGVVDVVRERPDGPEQLIAVIGGGDLLGEMALLDDAPRTAGARAASTVTVGRIAREDFLELVRNVPSIAEAVWEAVGRRHLDNALREQHQVAAGPRRHMVDQARFEVLDASGQRQPSGRSLFVVGGSVEHGGERHGAGSFLHPRDTTRHSAGTRVLHVPTREQAETALERA